jgi:hypothetical protein
VPVVPSWLLEPLQEQFSALLPARPVYDPAYPLGCHRRRICDRVIFEKLIQVPRFGCAYESIADLVDRGRRLRPAEADRAGIL